MKVYRSDRLGNAHDEGDYVAVEMETLEEKRKLRHEGDLPLYPFLVVFEQNGRLRRFPGVGQFQPNAEENAFLQSMRQLAIGAVKDLF